MKGVSDSTIYGVPTLRRADTLVGMSAASTRTNANHPASSQDEPTVPLEVQLSTALNDGIIEGVNIDEVKIDKTAFTTFTSFEDADAADRAHWRNASYADRLLALELMRQSAYGYNDPATRRLQRVLEIVRGV